MKGIVKIINLNRGMAAVETDGGLSVFEILEVTCSIELGDEISGKLESLGRETLINTTKNESMDVSIEDMHCSKERAIQLMR